MSGRLMKYEWRNLYKVECIILIVIAAFTLLGAVMLNMPVVRELFVGNVDAPETMITFFVMSFMGTVVMYIIALVGASFGSVIYQGIHFYKSMYSDEGYLTHTLPVSGHELLVSKIIVNAAWTMIISVSIMTSVFILIVSFVHALTYDMTYGEIMSEIADIFSPYFDTFTFTELHYIIYFVFLLFGGPMVTASTLFGALTLGQLAKKLKALFGIIAYFAISFAGSIISSVLQLVGMVINIGVSEFGGYSYELEQFFSRDMSIIISIIISVALYFASHSIITKRLNL